MRSSTRILVSPSSGRLSDGTTSVCPSSPPVLLQAASACVDRGGSLALPQKDDDQRFLASYIQGIIAAGLNLGLPYIFRVTRKREICRSNDVGGLARRPVESERILPRLGVVPGIVSREQFVLEVWGTEPLPRLEW